MSDMDQKPSRIVTRSDTPVFDTGQFEHMWRISQAMASAKLVPTHFQKSPADCLMVVEQALRWNMSPFAVASKTYNVGGKLAYEGQLVAAVVNTRAGLDGRLDYQFAWGTPAKDGMPRRETLSVRVAGRFVGEAEPRIVTVHWSQGYAMAKGAKDKWESQPEQQLSYYAARVWARRHCPEVLLGVQTADEADGEVIDATPAPPAPRRADFLPKERKPYEAETDDPDPQARDEAASEAREEAPIGNATAESVAASPGISAAEQVTFTLFSDQGEWIDEYGGAAEYLHGIEAYMKGGSPEDMNRIWKANSATIARILPDKTYAADIDRIQLLAFGRRK